MARSPKSKELKNARILKEYASWIYCTSCNKTIAYLCYVTYDNFEFDFTCNCGCSGSVRIDFGDLKDPRRSTKELVPIKNRMCCPEDHSALITFVEKNLKSYDCSIACLKCGNQYSKQNRE